MSKIRGNVVTPDDYVSKSGADTVRVFLMFIGPWEAGGPWNSSGIEGARRFLDRVWNVVLEPVRGHTEGAQSGRPGARGQED